MVDMSNPLRILPPTMKHIYQQLGLATAAMQRWLTDANLVRVGSARLPEIAGRQAYSAFNRCDLLSIHSGEPMT